MSDNTQHNSGQTPLEQVKEQQAAQQESREALDNRPDHNVDIPGHSEPSDKRKHPQRQNYGGRESTRDL